MTETKTLCDRCHRPMMYTGWTGIVKQYPKRLFLRKLFNGNPDGYSYSDLHIDLCRECCKSLDQWVKCGRDLRGESHDGD